jgi:sucrose-6-phosphate hydrolase SacC (GH32 family)
VRVGNLSVHSSRGNATGLRVTSRLVQMLPGEATLDLRVLVDRSIVEVFAARGRAVVSTRDYPSVDETAVRLWTSPHAPLMTHIHRARVWSMECGWVDDLRS